MLESVQEDWACQKAEEAGWFVRKVSWVGRRNAPDRLFAKEGRVLFIEFKKATNEQARAGQLREHERMRAAGVEVHLCGSPLAALRVLGVPF